MKISLKNEKQIELIKAMGSRNKATSIEAQELFAGYVGPVVQKVLNTVGTSNLIYTNDPIDEDDHPSYPVDNYRDEGEDYIQVWSQSAAGGLATSEVSGSGELKFTTYTLNSAVSIAKKYARKSRTEQVSKMLGRMANTILNKQEAHAWSVVCAALAQAQTNGAGHIIASNTESVFSVDDVSRLITLIKRFNKSYSGNTSNGSFGLTDLIVSPEIAGQIRGFAYNPVNTIGSQSTGPVALPDDIRKNIYNSAGASSIYGINIIDLVELGAGVNNKYNALFGNYATGNIAHGSSTFNVTDDEIIFGFDLSAGRDSFMRPLLKDPDNGSTFTVHPDDQWFTRTDKMGFYGGLDEGRICLDPRSVVGMVV